MKHEKIYFHIKKKTVKHLLMIPVWLIWAFVTYSTFYVTLNIVKPIYGDTFFWWTLPFIIWNTAAPAIFIYALAYEHYTINEKYK